MSFQTTIGVDEVGRGPLAGPVVAAAVILPEPLPEWAADIRDSKKISAAKREKLAELIMASSVYAIRDAQPHHIDDMNILYATLYAMKLAVEAACLRGPDGFKPERILVDGNHTIPTEEKAGAGWLRSNLPQTPVIDGDSLEKSIGAASIIAKVYRDALMVEAHSVYPEYGFDRHKGYGTKYHLEAIRKYGPCPIHRRTFRGVREYL